MGSILNFLIFFLKQPEVQCHHSSMIFMSMSVELGNNCHCSLNAVTPTGMSSSSSFRGRETVLVFSYKVLFKAELLCVNTDTTRGSTALDVQRMANAVHVSTAADTGFDVLLTFLL